MQIRSGARKMCEKRENAQVGRQEAPWSRQRTVAAARVGKTLIIKYKYTFSKHSTNVWRILDVYVFGAHDAETFNY